MELDSPLLVASDYLSSKWEESWISSVVLKFGWSSELPGKLFFLVYPSWGLNPGLLSQNLWDHCECVFNKSSDDWMLWSLKLPSLILWLFGFMHLNMLSIFRKGEFIILIIREYSMQVMNSLGYVIIIIIILLQKIWALQVLSSCCRRWQADSVSYVT